MIEDRFRDWVVDGPVKGFLFPAFIERDTDIHNMLYYTKKADDLQPEFVESMFGGHAPLSAPDQKDTFDAILTDTIGNDGGDYEVMKNLMRTILNVQEMKITRFWLPILPTRQSSILRHRMLSLK